MNREAMVNLAKMGIKLEINVLHTIPTHEDLKNMTVPMIAELCIGHFTDPEWPGVGGVQNCMKCPVFEKRFKDMPAQIRSQIKLAKGDADPDIRRAIFGDD